MRFQATHKLVTYLLVLSAFGALLSTGAVGVRPALIFVAALVVSWFVEPTNRGARLVERIGTPLRVGLGASFILTVWAVARRLPDPDLAPVLDLVLVLLGFKLYHRRSNRDDVHIFVLCFLLVLAAAALAGTFLFAVGFVAYVMMATWALILFHLRREMEENYLVKHSVQAPSQKVGISRILNSRRVVGAAFFGATGLVAVAVASGAVATFALVPRMGAGFVFGTPHPTGNLIGFSDDVTLGHYGVLSTENQTVALRATVPRIAALPTREAREQAVNGLYWRGTVYDRYEGGHWTRSRQPELRTELIADGRRVWLPGLGGAPEPAALAAAIAQEIDVVGLPVPMVFALDPPIAYELPSVRLGAAGELRLGGRWSGEVALKLLPPGSPPDLDGAADEGRPELRTFPGVRYVAYSLDRAAARTPPHAVPPLSARARAAYLQLPPSLSPRVRQLAVHLTAASPTAADRVQAVATWLRATHRYTLRVPRSSPGLDPVDSFLFEEPTGHCEYFASAMTLLLRAADIPARYVNGYLGGEWNDIGQYVAVRDNRAHSWVEAYLGQAGWVRVDATPPLPGPPRGGRLRQVFDSLDFYWTRWVVGYDLERQLELAHRLGRRVGVGDPAGPPTRRLPGWVLVLAAVALLAVAASRVWPHRAISATAPRAAPPGGDAPVQRLYRRASSRLARAGLPRLGSETPREYARRVGEAGLPGREPFQQLTELYTASRFGGRVVDGGVLRDLARRLARLGRPPAASPPG